MSFRTRYTARATRTSPLRTIATWGLPAASITEVFHVWRARDITKTARIWTTATAGVHCDPKASGTTSGATADHAEQRWEHNAGQEREAGNPHFGDSLLVLAHPRKCCVDDPRDGRCEESRGQDHDCHGEVPDPEFRDAQEVSYEQHREYRLDRDRTEPAVRGTRKLTS